MRKLPILEIEDSEEVFAFFAAMNAVGYNDENRRGGMSKTRKAVRNILAGDSWERKYPFLEQVFKKCHPWHLLNVLLAQKGQAVSRTKLSQQLRTFLKEPRVQEAQRVFKTLQAGGKRKLLHLLKTEVTRLGDFLEVPTKVERVVIIRNPLDAYWRGYSFKMGTTGYLVLGPGAEKNNGELIRHELLHLLAPTLRLPAYLTTVAKHRRLASLGYTNSRVINREYVVRSLNILYEWNFFGKGISKAIERERRNFPHIRKAVALVGAKIKRDLP